MKLILAPCDIAILTASQAWENYCNALHIAMRCPPKDRHKFHYIARQSLDQHFAAVERRMVLANERDTA